MTRPEPINAVRRMISADPVLARALNSCNVCDGRIKTPNPGGYCDECLATAEKDGPHE